MNDIGSNLATLLSNLVGKLKGHLRVIAIATVIGFLGMFFSLVFLRDNNIQLGLLVSVLIIIVPPIYAILSGGTATRDRKTFDLTIVAYKTSKANVISDAEVLVTGIPRPVKARTDHGGTWIYRYPIAYVEQNRTINVRVEKDTEHGERVDYPLTARSDTLAIELTSDKVASAPENTGNVQPVPGIVHSAPPPEPLCTPLLSYEQIQILIECITYGGSVSAMPSRIAFCKAIGIDHTRFVGLHEPDAVFAQLIIERDPDNPEFLLKICRAVRLALSETKQRQLDTLRDHIKLCGGLL